MVKHNEQETPMGAPVWIIDDELMLNDEHEAGEHHDAIVVDCQSCRDDAMALGMGPVLP